MRSRNIKPGFFKNEELAECDPLARILFIGLWCLADRDGRLRDRPVRLKVEILPYDKCNPDLLLDQLAKHGFIIRYESQGVKVIQVCKFKQHQNPHPKEVCDELPPPPVENAVKLNCISRPVPEKPEQEIAVYLNPSSLNPSSLNPSSDATGNLEQTTLDQFPEVLRTSDFATAWAEWKSHRSQIRQALTPLTIKRQLVKLSRLGPEAAIATIHRSIENGWIGLFPREDGTLAENGRREANGTAEERTSRGAGGDRGGGVGRITRIQPEPGKYANLSFRGGEAPKSDNPTTPEGS